MNEELTDEQLVERIGAASGADAAAFEILIRRHQEKVLANCRYLTRSPADSEDLAQEVFVKAFFGLRRFEGRSLFRSWLQRIKVNHCLNFLAKRKRRMHVSVEVMGEDAEGLQVAPTAERDLKAGRSREHIRQVLESMSDTLRVPLVLRDADGLSYQDIADHLGIGLSAVKMRIKRAREEFRERYAQAEESGAPAGGEAVASGES